MPLNFFESLFPKKPRVQKVNLQKRFDLLGRVGQGSMSRVWRARDTETQRNVALKVLDPKKTQKYEERFKGLDKPCEGEIAVQLDHPHIVRTFEHGISTPENLQFLVMEFVEGTGLSYLVDTQNQIMKENCLRFMIELGEAIAYFHQNNWIHRDICPRNVLLNSDYSIKLIDFGLVVPNTEPFRRPGNRTGTANYMAPELIKRQKTDQRIDIFSFAVTAFEMHTRLLPWKSSVTLDAVLQHINSPPRDIRDLAPTIDDEVAEIIMRGLALYPDDRWQTMDEMVAALKKAQRRIESEPA